MRSRVLGATIVAGAATVCGAGCGGDETPAAGAGPTLPPIITTSTTTTTITPATTIPAYYEIQRGDTLTEVAVAFGLPVQAIMDLNGITNPDSIQAGQIIALPPTDIVATQLPPTAPGQTAPTVAGQTAPPVAGETPTTVPGPTTA